MTRHQATKAEAVDPRHKKGKGGPSSFQKKKMLEQEKEREKQVE